MNETERRNKLELLHEDLSALKRSRNEGMKFPSELSALGYDHILQQSLNTIEKMVKSWRDGFDFDKHNAQAAMMQKIISLCREDIGVAGAPTYTIAFAKRILCVIRHVDDGACSFCGVIFETKHPFVVDGMPSCDKCYTMLKDF